MAKNTSLLIGSFFIFFFVAMMLFGPYLPFVDSHLEEEIVRMEDGKIETPPYPPSKENPFGSDERGKDLLSMIVMGTKETMLIIFSITGIRYLIAVPLGMLASSNKGPAHYIVNGWNQLFSALPTLFSAIILMNLPIFYFQRKSFGMVDCLVSYH
ncbi:hypothetical protein [Bacillus sp. Marseille-Q3570]|uniref:hypothetical protein n=1 Tax=Bacillus sp. Marseille-Q3570 TaxID=2963522 RepID=UPI0021B7607A|nr:hypothetical protein [Bacillus sp. Marseille-Q3570]